jgi:hypothetical protein
MLQCDFEVRESLAPALRICINFAQKAPGLRGDMLVREVADRSQGRGAIARSRKRNNELQLFSRVLGFHLRFKFSLVARHFMARRDMQPPYNYWQNDSCVWMRSGYTPKKFQQSVSEILRP